MNRPDADESPDRPISNRTLGWLLALGVFLWFLTGVVWIYLS